MYCWCFSKSIKKIQSASSIKKEGFGAYLIINVGVNEEWYMELNWKMKTESFLMSCLMACESLHWITSRFYRHNHKLAKQKKILEQDLWSNATPPLCHDYFPSDILKINSKQKRSWTRADLLISLCWAPATKHIRLDKWFDFLFILTLVFAKSGK